MYSSAWKDFSLYFCNTHFPLLKTEFFVWSCYNMVLHQTAFKITKVSADVHLLLFVGIGLNIDNQKPTTCLNSVLQRLGYAANKLQREDIIAAFFNKFESFYDIFISQGDCFRFYRATSLSLFFFLYFMYSWKGAAPHSQLNIGIHFHFICTFVILWFFINSYSREYLVIGTISLFRYLSRWKEKRNKGINDSVSSFRWMTKSISLAFNVTILSSCEFHSAWCDSWIAFGFGFALSHGRTRLYCKISIRH